MLSDDNPLFSNDSSHFATLVESSSITESYTIRNILVENTFVLVSIVCVTLSEI